MQGNCATHRKETGEGIIIPDTAKEKSQRGGVKRNPYKIDTDKPAVKKKSRLVHNRLADCEMKICPGKDSWYDHWVN